MAQAWGFIANTALGANTIKITKVTQNNTGLYTKESSQQTFEKPNNNLDVKFEKAYQNHNNEILRTRKANQKGEQE